LLDKDYFIENKILRNRDC